MVDTGTQDVALAEEGERKEVDVAAVWGVPLTAMHCTHCGQAHLVPSDALSPPTSLGSVPGAGSTPPLLCPLCLQGPVMPQPVYLQDEPPEQVVPYAVLGSKLAETLERWTQGVPFRPDELRAAVLAQRARRYLIPLWLVDGQVQGVWRADVGFNYQAISYQDRYSEMAGWRSQQVREDRVRWEPRVGRIHRSYENLDAPALDDHRALMDRLGDFDLGQRTSYSPEAVAGAVVRIPSLEPEAAWTGAETAFVHAAQEECRQAAGADHIRDFVLQATYEGLNWTLLLLPAYVTSYREGERVWPVIVNGQSGRVSGVRRASTRKATTISLVLGPLALALFVMGGLLALLGAAVPLVAAIGGVLLVSGLLLAAIAPAPAIVAWAFNRRSLLDERR